MINATFQEAHSQEWIVANIQKQDHDLVILRQVIPWRRICQTLSHYYHPAKGCVGKSLRLMVALLILMRLHKLSDQRVVEEVKENRYYQHFCNVPDKGLQTFLHPSSLCVFRKRLGRKGFDVIEQAVFERLRRAGVIKAEMALIDSTVLPANIAYPNDVHLLRNGFKKMKQIAKLHHIGLWWDDQAIARMWRAFNLEKEADRLSWLARFNLLFVPTLGDFAKLVSDLKTSPKRLANAKNVLDLLQQLEAQTVEKLNGTLSIPNRIVSLDDPIARPIKKGKKHPSCEFGSTLELGFNREGFLVTLENFIGQPNDKTLLAKTLSYFQCRMKGEVDAVITDLGYRSENNKKVGQEGAAVFLGRTSDVEEATQAACKSARSATEGLIATAKHHRGLGRSLYLGFAGHCIWSRLCQIAINLKKFIQLLIEENVSEASQERLGLL